MDWFENWFSSPYYKILYQHRNQDDAQLFLQNLLAFLKPNAGARMVDIACGEGRFSNLLAQNNFDVIGIDLSQNSIRKAKENEQENLHFYVQDMRYPFYINYFDFAFNFFTSFGYFQYNRDNYMAARSFRACLKPNGILVIDYLNRNYILQHLVAQETKVIDGIEFNIHKRLEDNHFIKEIHLPDQHLHFKERVAAFSLDDFKLMFEGAGLTLEHTFGDYQLNPFDEMNAPRLIMVFKKN